jgi:hypothetical protein
MHDASIEFNTVDFGVCIHLTSGARAPKLDEIDIKTIAICFLDFFGPDSTTICSKYFEHLCPFLYIIEGQGICFLMRVHVLKKGVTGEP